MNSATSELSQRLWDCSEYIDQLKAKDVRLYYQNGQQKYLANSLEDLKSEWNGTSDKLSLATVVNEFCDIVEGLCFVRSIPVKKVIAETLQPKVVIDPQQLAIELASSFPLFAKILAFVHETPRTRVREGKYNVSFADIKTLFGSYDEGVCIEIGKQAQAAWRNMKFERDDGDGEPRVWIWYIFSPAQWATPIISHTAVSKNYGIRD